MQFGRWLIGFSQFSCVLTGHVGGSSPQQTRRDKTNDPSSAEEVWKLVGELAAAKAYAQAEDRYIRAQSSTSRTPPSRLDLSTGGLLSDHYDKRGGAGSGVQVNSAQRLISVQGGGMLPQQAIRGAVVAAPAAVPVLVGGSYAKSYGPWGPPLLVGQSPREVGRNQV
eukprot:g3637.t1